MSINWYPGHMAKAKRLLGEQLARTDLVVEVCDARLPLSSRNPDLNTLLANKRRLLLLNKADLADPALTKEWERLFRDQGIQAYALNTLASARRLLPLIENALRDKIQSGQNRGIRRTMRGMIVGVPNVGKSTLINQLKGKSTIKAEDRPGVTRSATWFRVTPYLELMDSPGLLWPKLSDPLAARRLAYIGSIRDEVHDVYQLALSLLDELMASHPELVLSRFKLQDESLRGPALLQAICQSRGYLLRGGELDEERGVTAVLDEFRSGKIGRITLEKAPMGQEPDEA